MFLVPRYEHAGETDAGYTPSALLQTSLGSILHCGRPSDLQTSTLMQPEQEAADVLR